MKKLMLMLSMAAVVSIVTISCKQNKAAPEIDETVILTDEEPIEVEDPQVVDEPNNAEADAEVEVNLAEKTLEAAIASGDKEAEASAQKVYDEAKANLEALNNDVNTKDKVEDKGVENENKEGVDPFLIEKAD